MILLREPTMAGRSLRHAALGAIFAVLPLIVVAQGPVDLSGKWTLDTVLSDSPEQIAAAIRADLGQSGGEQLFGDSSGRGGFGRGGGGRRGPDARAGSAQDAKPNEEEQKRIDELTERLRYPPTSMTIDQTPAAVTVTDEQQRARTLTPNGRREKQATGAAALDVTTRWDGPQLVSEEDLGGGRLVRYTYSIVQTTKQLLVRVTIDRTAGFPGPFQIRFVYNRASE
jgi:hypothetical protein